MQYRVTYLAHDAKIAETMIVGGHIRAVHALIDYANKWNDQIISIEARESRTRVWRPTNITQRD